MIPGFDWERDYGPLYRACPSAFWLAPEPGERKRDVIDVRPNAASSVVTGFGYLAQQAVYQSRQSPYETRGLQNVYGVLDSIADPGEDLARGWSFSIEPHLHP